MKSIPIIDLKQTLDPKSSAASHAAADLHTALSTIGFAYIKGHNVSSSLRAAAFSAMKEFHASRLEQKQSLAINGFHRGYMGLATSTIVSSTVAKVTKPNISESLMIMHTVPETDPCYGQEPLQGPNQWPDWLPDFEPTMRAYEMEMERLARYVIELIGMSLGLPHGSLARYFEKPTIFLRALHYPPQEVNEQNSFGSAPHTDYGVITLLAQDNTGGLQVRPVGGDWIDAPPIRDTFVMNVGDMLSRWTNGRFVSTPHRVINTSGGDRYSLPYFFDPSMDAVIEALPTCVDAEHPAQFPPVVYGDYLLERLNKNYDYRHMGRRDAAMAEA